MWLMSVTHGIAERHQYWAFGVSCARCFTAPRRRLKTAGFSNKLEYSAEPQSAQNDSAILLPLSAVLTYVFGCPRGLKFSIFTGTLARYGPPETV